jgi:hypothetical protein
VVAITQVDSVPVMLAVGKAIRVTVNGKEVN